MVKLWCGDFIWDTQLDEITPDSRIAYQARAGVIRPAHRAWTTERQACQADSI